MESDRRRVLGHHPRRAFGNVFGLRRAKTPHAFAATNCTTAFATSPALKKSPASLDINASARRINADSGFAG